MSIRKLTPKEIEKLKEPKPICILKCNYELKEDDISWYFKPKD
jgi:predicted transcriptional regulator